MSGEDCRPLTKREQLEAIMADMDAAYAAVRAAGYPRPDDGRPFDSPEHEALEAVYVRLRAWNAEMAR